jgi:hypothetical protein
MDEEAFRALRQLFDGFAMQRAHICLSALRMMCTKYIAAYLES